MIETINQHGKQTGIEYAVSYPSPKNIPHNSFPNTLISLYPIFRYKEYRKINELIQEIWNNQSLNNFAPPLLIFSIVIGVARNRKPEIIKNKGI